MHVLRSKIAAEPNAPFDPVDPKVIDFALNYSHCCNAYAIANYLKQRLLYFLLLPNFKEFLFCEERESGS
jgi:hypothetical protein